MSDTMAGFEERVRERAYSLWEREGRPEGRAEEHWRRAAELEAAEAAHVGDDGRRTEAGEADGSSASAAPPRAAKTAAKRRAPVGAGESAGATRTAKRKPAGAAARVRVEPATGSAPSDDARPPRQPSAPPPRKGVGVVKADEEGARPPPR